MLKEGLYNDGTTDGGSGGDEKRNEGATCCHGGVGIRLCASDVEAQATDQRDDEDRASSETGGQRSPEKRCASDDGDLNRGEVRRLL